MAKQTFTTGQVLTAAQVNSLQANDFNQTVSVKTASYTLVAADKGTRIEFNTSGSVTCTVNTGIFDAGDTVIIQNRGAGTVTVTAGTATVNTNASLAVAQYGYGTLYFISASASIFFADAGGIPASAFTAKGDVLVGTGSGTYDKLGVGANGTTIVAKSSETTGLIWQRDTDFVGVHCSVSAAQNTTAGTAYTVEFGAESFDTDGFHSTSSNTGRITIPSGLAGKYLLTAFLTQESTTTQQNELRLYKNNAAIGAGQNSGIVATVVNTNGIQVNINASMVVDAAVNDYFTVVSVINGANKQVLGGYFSAVYLGA